jgi:HEAT repeat protein
MVEAVENAHTVCCFLTAKYEVSPYCKLELQYAKKLNKRIAPCMAVDKNQWRPTKEKWLDLIIGSIVSFDFSDSSEEIITRKTLELIYKVKSQPSDIQDNLPEPKDKLVISIKQKYLQKGQIKSIFNETMSFSIEKTYINLSVVTTKQEEEEGARGKLARQNQSCANVVSNDEEIWSKKLINVEDIFKECRYKRKRILFLGRAGIGKSIFCEYVTYLWAKGDLWSEYELLVLIRLHELTKERYPRLDKYMPMDLIENEYFPGDRLSFEERKTLREMCENRNILWILDGYDKVTHRIPEQVKHAFNEIIDKEHYILTSRPCAINLSYEIKIEIIGLLDTEIENYIGQYFHLRSDEIPKLLNFLKSNPSAWAIAHTPVNLELLCTVWIDTDWSNTANVTITTLYEHFVNFLCKQYLKQKNIDYDSNDGREIYEYCAKELCFLENLAFSTMEPSSFIVQPELIAKVGEDSEFNLFSSAQLLNLGIFQEYFAARYLARRLSTDEQSIIKFINSYKYDQRFTMLFVFTTGILVSRSDSRLLDLFMNTIESEPRDLIGMYHIQLIIQLFDELQCCKKYQNLEKHLQDICNWFQFAMKQTNKVIQSSVANSTTLSKSTYFRETLISMKGETSTNQTQCINEDFDENTIHTLIHTLRDSEWFQRLNASETLVKMGEKAATKDTLLALIDLFRNPNKNARDVARHTLVKISDKAAAEDLISVLLAALRDPEWIVRKTACSAIRAIGDKVTTNDTINTLIKTLSDSDERVQDIACQTLVKIGKKTANDDRINALTHLLQDRQWSVRKAACTVLKAVGEKAATTDMINALLQILRDDKGILRVTAREALAKIGKNVVVHHLIRKLIQTMQNSQHDVREVACQVLTKIGPKVATRDAINTLIQALQDEEWNVRKAACESLKAFGDKAVTRETVQALITTLGDKEEEVRHAARDTLINMPSKIATKETIDAIIHVLHYRDSSVRQTLVAMFMKALDNGNIAILLDALKYSDDDVKEAACDALGHKEKSAATHDIIEALIEILRNPKIRDKIAAWKALARMCYIATPTRERVTYYEARRTPTVSLIVTALRELLKCDYVRFSHDSIYVLNQALEYHDDHLRYDACELIANKNRYERYETDTTTVHLLVQVLKDSYGRLKAAACEALKAIGHKFATREVIDAIVEALQDSDPHVKSAACETITAMSEQAATKNTIDALSRTLRDPKSWVRESACKALIAMVDQTTMKDSIGVLVQALQDSDCGVRIVACRAFIEIKDKAVTKEVIDALVQALQDSNCDVRRAACSAFEKIAEKAAAHDIIYALNQALRDPDEYVQLGACRALAAIDEKAITKDVLDTLSHLLRHSELHVKYTVTETLIEMANRAVTNKPIDIFIRLPQDPETEVKSYAYKAFEKVGEEATTNDIISALSQVIRDSNEGVSHKACEALAAMGEKAATKESIDALLYILSLPKSYLKETALQALRAMGEKGASSESIDALIQLIQDPDSNLMKKACEVLRAMGEKAATEITIGVLIQKLRDPKSNVKNCARETLVELAEKKVLNDFMDVFTLAMQDPEAFVKVTACKVLTKMGEKVAGTSTVNAAIQALKDPESDVKTSACELPATMVKKETTTEAINRLIQALQDPQASVRRAAYQALANMGDWWIRDDAVEVVVQTLRDSDTFVKEAACEILAKIGEKVAKKDIIDTLVEILRDHGQRAEDAACKALTKMGIEAARKDVIDAVIDFARKSLWIKYIAREAIITIWQRMITEDRMDVLMNLLQDPNDELKCIACKALEGVGDRPVTKEIIDLLIKMLCHRQSDVRKSYSRESDVRKSYSRESDVRKAALEALIYLDEKVVTKDTINALIDILHSPDTNVRYAVRDALSGMYKKTTNQDVINAIIQALQHPDEDARKLVCETFIWAYDKAASSDTIDAIIENFRDSDESIRRIMRKTFSRIKICMTTKDTMDSLIQVFRDPDDDVRELAYENLLKMDEKTVTKDVVNILIETMQHAGWLVRYDVVEIFDRWKFVKFDSDQMNQILSPSGQINDTGLKVMLMSDSILSGICEKYIVELKNGVFSEPFFRYEKVPTNRLLEIWLADSRSEWISLLVHSALVQNTAIIRIGEDLILHNVPNEVICQPVDEEKFSCFLQVVRQCLMEMGLCITDPVCDGTAV